MSPHQERADVRFPRLAAAPLILLNLAISGAGKTSLIGVHAVQIRAGAG